MRSRFTALWLLSALAFAGCTSMSSTMLTRNESNLCWQKIKHLKGVPITVKVPTHLKVYVYEKHFLEERDGQIQVVKLDFVIRDFASEFLYTEKVFTVDFKRPAAGSYNLDLDLTEDQYIQKISHDVTDETIKDVTALLGALPGLGIKFAEGGEGERGTLDERLKEVKAVVAVGLFEIDDPEFEAQVTEFVNCHMNQAHDAWVLPPNATIRRVPLHPSQLGEAASLCAGSKAAFPCR